MRLRTLTITAGLLASIAVPAAAASTASAAPAKHVYSAVTVKVAGKTCTLTMVNGLESNGTIFGTEFCGHAEAFLKPAGGKATLFKLPATDARYTYASNIASNGIEALDGNKTAAGPATGYLRSPSGTLTAVIDPAAKGRSTVVNGVNRHGEAVGYACTNAKCSKPASFTFSAGTFTPFTFGLASGHNAEPSYITDSGVIFGTYYDRHNAAHGFQQNPNGAVKTINSPGAGKKAGEGTFILGAANDGSTCGEVVGANHGESGFVVIRHKGHIINVQPKGPKVYFFTEIYAINGHGEFAGLAARDHHPKQNVGFTAHR